MRVIQIKEDMMSYYQLKKNGKKQGRPKNQDKVVKNEKNLENLVKNWYYMHFDQKNTQKIIK